jgi:polar amino acid transport system substrate-binding protein
MISKKLRTINIVLTIFIFLFAISQISTSINAKTDTDPKQVGSKLQQIKAAGKIVVGTSADYPPYEFYLLNDKEGELVGIDIDIAKVIAEELGVELEIKDLIFSRIFKALEAGQIDIGIAGLHPTEERKKNAMFSEVYHQAIQTLLIHSKNSEYIKTIEDLRGKKVGVQKDSIQEDLAKGRIEGAEFSVRETIEELVIILEKGLVDAVIFEKPVSESYVRRNKKLMSVPCKTHYDLLGSAIAIKKSNTDLLNEINRILRKLKKENKIQEFVENAKILTNKR